MCSVVCFTAQTFNLLLLPGPVFRLLVVLILLLILFLVVHSASSRQYWSSWTFLKLFSIRHPCPESLSMKTFPYLLPVRTEWLSLLWEAANQTSHVACPFAPGFNWLLTSTDYWLLENMSKGYFLCNNAILHIEDLELRQDQSLLKTESEPMQRIKRSSNYTIHIYYMYICQQGELVNNINFTLGDVIIFKKLLFKPIIGVI